jgi:hypothetical protein
MRMHPMMSIRLWQRLGRRTVATLTQRRLAMNTPPRFRSFDEALFLLVLFLPVSLLLAGSMTLVAASAL